MLPDNRFKRDGRQLLKVFLKSDLQYHPGAAIGNMMFV